MKRSRSPRELVEYSALAATPRSETGSKSMPARHACGGTWTWRVWGIGESVTGSVRCKVGGMRIILRSAAARHGARGDPPEPDPGPPVARCGGWASHDHLGHRHRLPLDDLGHDARHGHHLRRLALAGGSPPESTPPTLTAADERRFRRTARRLHMKRCPECSAPIVKNGGCDHMMCMACQKHFSWRAARVVAPCHCLHFRSDLSGLAGVVNSAHVCRGCSPVATAKLCAWRAGLAAVALPVPPPARRTALSHAAGASSRLRTTATPHASRSWSVRTHGS